MYPSPETMQIRIRWKQLLSKVVHHYEKVVDDIGDRHLGPVGLHERLAYFQRYILLHVKPRIRRLRHLHDQNESHATSSIHSRAVLTTKRDGSHTQVLAISDRHA